MSQVVADVFRRVRKPAESPQNERRRALAFAIDELEFRREEIAAMAPATDHCAYMMWKVRALELAIGALQKPYFEVSPLL